MLKWCVLTVVALVLLVWALLGRTRRRGPRQAVDESRRRFLTMSASLVHDEGATALGNKVAGGVAAVTERRNPKSKVRLLPAGAESESRFLSLCNACLACVEACPKHLWEPGMKLGEGVSLRLNLRQGSCDASCSLCNDACTTGALQPISPEAKQRVQIGHAIWVRENCQAAQGEACTACADACPQNCIEMIHNGRHTYPIISSQRCTGCGACEACCPASPLKAIYVEAFSTHREIYD